MKNTQPMKPNQIGYALKKLIIENYTCSILGNEWEIQEEFTDEQVVD